MFVTQDNINTDGIYPGKYTYQEVDAATQAKVVMENYDPDFVEMVTAGNVLVGGFNFGTGSSREQAATALKHAGFVAVIVGSVSETYKRNALNNGLLVIEIPTLVNALKERFGTKDLTIVPNINATLDFVKCTATLADEDGNTERYGFAPVGTIAQDLILAGGLEGWVKQESAAEAAV